MLRAWLAASVISVLALTAPSGSPAAPAAPTTVVATLPVLAEFVHQVGRERVAVTSLVSSLENEHAYSPKSGDVAALRQAQMLVKIGLGLDGWVDDLVLRAGNRGLVVVNSSNGVALLKANGQPGAPVDTPEHRRGDPHIWLDPRNARIMIRHITEALVRIAPASKGYFMRNQAAYFRELDRIEAKLDARVKPVRHRRIVSHHAAWAYFARRFGFVVRDSILSPTDAEPSSRGLAQLIGLIKRERIEVIVSEPQLDQTLPRSLAEKTGARIVLLTPMPGRMQGSETYIAMLEYDVDQLVAALLK
jgi:zinc/manganese transport system substrate-binding protein/zinc transport system substrate-binding protein/manganese/iron transport system substrate-binding protein